jgi:ElaB/YqjD/DUF883 family membrane-anchored ribosome-binding protein
MDQLIRRENPAKFERRQTRMSKRRKDPMTPEEQLRSVAQQILYEARRRAHFEMECLTQMVLQEAKAAARYARDKPFYIS